MMILLYETEDSIRNAGFIEELQRFGDFDLLVWDDWSKSGQVELALQLSGKMVLYRLRRPEAARLLEDSGAYLVNRAEVNCIANDKAHSFQLLAVMGLPVIPTYTQPSAYPCIMKKVDGYGGTDVKVVNSPDDLPEDLSGYIFQPVIEHTADVRAYVIGNEVVGAVKRTPVGSFKANYSLGGSVEKYELDAEQEQGVLEIARALKSDYIGVDFLLLPDGRHLFNEIEDPVGARSFYETHDENIAELLVEYLKDLEKERPFRVKE